jgi:transposase
MSPQRPLYRAYQQDPERVRAWKRETYPAIRAAAAQAGGTIFFADEARVRTDHHAGTTWAPVGRTPVVTATGERKSVNMVSAVSPGGQIHFDVFEGSMNAARFIEFCAKLVHDCPTPVFLIVDGSSAHTAKVVKEYVASTGGRLNLFFLPPYSPDLNPDEWVWKNVKHDSVGRTVAMNRDHLRSIVYDALRRLQMTPRIIKEFFADPCLAYISGES